MKYRKPRVLLISSQPIQNPIPLQMLAQHPQLEMLMAYCSLPEAKVWQGAENLNKEFFDVPMLEGYPWENLPNYSPWPSLNNAFGLINPSVIRLVRQFDCCVVYGHAYISFWLAITMAKLTGKPLLLSTDATYLEPPEGSNWKVPLKKRLLPYLYNRIADAVLVPSTAAKTFIHSLGVPEQRIFVTPYVVDNRTIATVAAQTNRNQHRAEWNVPADALVVMFCGKFIPRKCPQDLLKAFALSNVPNSYLVLVGDGPLKATLQQESQQLGIDNRIRFLGFINYSRLPSIYASSDLLVHPAEHEPYGLPVNEAMVCGIPVVVSDRVGAGYDLVKEGVTGYTYPCGDVEALATLLQKTLADPEALQCMGKAAVKRVESWSPRENVETTVEAVQSVVAIRHEQSQLKGSTRES